VIRSRFAESSAKLFFDPRSVPKDTFTGLSAVLKKLLMHFMPDMALESLCDCFSKNLGKRCIWRFIIWGREILEIVN